MNGAKAQAEKRAEKEIPQVVLDASDTIRSFLMNNFLQCESSAVKLLQGRAGKVI